MTLRIHNFIRFAGTVAGALLVLSFFDPGFMPRSEAADVSIDGSIAFQRIDGFGTSERVFDDPHVFNNFNSGTKRAATVLTPSQQDEVLDKLYRDLRLTRVRPAQPDSAVETPGATTSGIEPANDNPDPDLTDWTKFNFVWKNLDAHIDYIVRARQRGVDTWFLSPLYREAWMRTTMAADAAEYAEWLLAQALRCKERGVPLPYLSVANEPSYSRNTLPGPFIRDVIKILGPKLRAAGLATLFVIPDDVRSSDAAAKTQVVLADPLARPYVGALATHLYDESITNVNKMKALSQQYSLPLWMTEFTLSLAGSLGFGGGAFDWADVIHQLLAVYDVSAVDYLWGFIGGSGALVNLKYDKGGTEAYTGYSLSKEYYVMGQYSRFIRPGSFRIQCLSADANVKVSAYVDWPALAVVAVNNGSANQSVSFKLLGLPATTVANPTRTSGTENWASQPAIDASTSTFSAILPHQSVTTFAVTLPPLRLESAVTPNYQVMLSWPAAAAGFKLHSAGRLIAPDWLLVTNNASISGNRRVMTLDPTSGSQFYRLSKVR